MHPTIVSQAAATAAVQRNYRGYRPQPGSINDRWG